MKNSKYVKDNCFLLILTFVITLFLYTGNGYAAGSSMSAATTIAVNTVTYDSISAEDVSENRRPHFPRR